MSSETPHNPNAGGTASALAILGATALGGLLGSRVNKIPVVLGAGAAAYALLRTRRQPSSTGVQETPAPQPPAASTPHPDSFVLEWLERQRQADAAAPSVELPTEDDTQETAEPPDNYVPLPLLPDDETSPPADLPDSYAELTDPVAPPPPAVTTIDEPPLPAAPIAPAAPFRASEPIAPVAHITPVFPAPSGLNFEPMPALNEEADTPFTPPEPVVLPPLSPFSSTPFIFEGGNFPDHIEVGQPAIKPEPFQAADPAQPATESDPVQFVEPVQPDAQSAPVHSAEPEPAPIAPPEPPANVPEIAVELASPGEASFDPPLAGLPASTWPPSEPESEVATPPDPAPVMADGEFVLRPQPQAQNSILPKAPSSAPWIAKHTPIVDASDLPKTPAAVTPAPDFPKDKKRPKSDWNSWWQGD